jgi:hypothetical protein
MVALMTETKESQVLELEALTRCCGVTVNGDYPADPATVKWLARKELAIIRHPDEKPIPPIVIKRGVPVWMILLAAAVAWFLRIFTDN